MRRLAKEAPRTPKSPKSLSPASIELQKERAERLNALRGVTTHFNNRCWIKNSELRAKYSLRQTTPQGSNRSLRKAAATAAERREPSTPPPLPPPPELNNQRYFRWSPRQNCWLVDLGSDVHVCNDRSLVTGTRIGGSTSDGTSPGRGGLENDSEGLLLKSAKRLLPPDQPVQSCQPWVAFWALA